jgi:hypothetical protein
MKGVALYWMFRQMKGAFMKQGVWFLIVIIVVFLTGCVAANQHLMDKQATWPMTSMAKEEMMDYFKNNAETLDPIEGVWVESETIRWVNVTTGLRGAHEYPRSYVFAVIRDPNEENVFNGYILESVIEQWNKMGMKKVVFHKMAAGTIYEMHWFMGDFTKKIKNITLPPNKGVFSDSSNWAEHPYNYESNSVYLKQYPTVIIDDPMPKKLPEPKGTPVPVE